jgi:DUF4097 and DUF4098 domain-containing protein YvlB
MTTFDTPEPITARINSRSGNVTVTARDTSTTTVEMSGESERRQGEQVHIDFHHNTLRIEAPHVGGWGRSSDVNFTVVVPTHSSLQIDATSGEVTCRGVFDNVRINAASGNASVDTAAGPARIESASGNVTLDTAHAQVFLSAASGDVRLGDAHGDDPVEVNSASGNVDIGTVNGPLSVGGASGDIRVTEARRDVTANSASGNVTLDLVHTGAVTAQSNSGDIRVRVAAGIPTWLDLHSLSGDIGTDQADDNGPADGEDSLELRANTVSGNIRIKRGR